MHYPVQMVEPLPQYRRWYGDRRPTISARKRLRQAFDAIIIGSGQAGNPLAHNLADNGQTVALIEREHMGGSCINYGCSPTKTMLASAQAAQDARRGAEIGIYTGPVGVDLARIVDRKNKLVREWRGGQEHHATGRPNISLIRGSARFTTPQVVEVGYQQLTAPKIFINTGTSPLILPIEGIEEVPYARFTDPELGRAGLTERDAREQGYNVRVGTIPMGWVARAIEANRTQGLMKVVVDIDTDRILGAAILGYVGGELVQTLTALMLADAPWTVLDRAMYIHPTMTEGFFTLMDNVG